MNVTEVSIVLVDDPADRHERLRAYAAITLDDALKIHDLRVIEGLGGLFLAMPSRKLTYRCPHCGAKNVLTSWHCQCCGGGLDADRVRREAINPDTGRAKLNADIVHPINAQTREAIQTVVLAAYRAERERVRALAANPIPIPSVAVV